ncbi:hypothetical protein PF005_g8980 [Phytophthora fragariae]|uniref:RxLR effector protein n=1 Tax=Phytophthora fragariae TaxID=53985 RepID=A0A6A3SHC5_9STRA|nr:hypothetical protein PF003_g3059 [Phytophthora fragariae]KAE8940394.1 hypothetical protein PF009_g9805 [Phytophthora fragariae]KAE9014849.1 hypothetical protein PF011_g7886 [Phytophthora fragariae]KAE9111119.1 hypothetical protein PF010_g10934 [Phytophthora fragariae]KAE9112116.1 hypothetical protein PF007_g11226 [Phytophthora fragariae]
MSFRRCLCFVLCARAAFRSCCLLEQRRFRGSSRVSSKTGGKFVLANDSSRTANSCQK